MKHNFNLNQIILLCENGEVITDDGTKFQITEVKSETVTPDYSYLIGKWVRKTSDHRDKCFVKNNWYFVTKPINDFRAIIDEQGVENGLGDNTEHFDLSNPLDYNPTELVGKYYDGLKLEGLVYNANGKPYFFNAEGGTVSFSCSNITISEVTDTPPAKSLKYEDVVGEVKPLYYCLNEGLIRKDILFKKGFHYKTVATERDAKKVRATAQLLVVMHAANGGEWIPKHGEYVFTPRWERSVKIWEIARLVVYTQVIYFRTREDAEKALADNKQLFNEYFGIDE